MKKCYNIIISIGYGAILLTYIDFCCVCFYKLFRCTVGGATMRISKNSMMRIRSLREDGIKPPRDFYGYLLCNFEVLVKPNSAEFRQYNDDAFDLMARY